MLKSRVVICGVMVAGLLLGGVGFAGEAKKPPAEGAKTLTGPKSLFLKHIFLIHAEP